MDSISRAAMDLMSPAAFAASAALVGVTLIPLGIFWGFNMCGRRGKHQPQPLKLTRIFLHLAFPTFFLAAVAGIINPAIVAADLGWTRYSFGAAMASVYAPPISGFLTNAAGIFASQAVYLSGLCVLYLVLAKQKWWSAVRLDTFCAMVLLVALDIAWFAKRISDIVTHNVDNMRLEWLIVMIDLTLCLVAALNVGVAIYCAAKLKRRGDLAVGKVSFRSNFRCVSCNLCRSLTYGCCSYRVSSWRHLSSGCSAAPSSWRLTSRASF
ncbi:hypothetical protein B0I37DRAFT_58333 [Chaetomium sp. MPI-CAGE-AT-0009]|nr:hypothetical protein B0I37DRAFT_58333 [Chaetomium sp. MPI-CAGE-AT-0009]